jgi:hypothetical protein
VHVEVDGLRGRDVARDQPVAQRAGILSEGLVEATIQ